ncbi:MAG: hypothetical protein ABIK52_01345, partial [Bacteroidota bacterium]
ISLFRYFAISLFRYFTISLFRYFATSLPRYFTIAASLPASLRSQFQLLAMTCFTFHHFHHGQ